MPFEIVVTSPTRCDSILQMDIAYVVMCMQNTVKQLLFFPIASPYTIIIWKPQPGHNSFIESKPTHAGLTAGV